MISYSDIVKKSYTITLNFPVLWLFGLFVVGGFNVNFFHADESPIRVSILVSRVQNLGIYFENHPAVLAGVSVAVLLVSMLALLLTNWSRIMLILGINSIVKEKGPELEKHFPRSKDMLRSVVVLSLLTTVLMVIVAAIVFGVPLLVPDQPQLQTIFWILSTLIFLPLAFTISCINIFASFFLLIHKRTLSDSLNLATDLFVSKWTYILGLTLVLVVIYLVCFISGVAVIWLARLLTRTVLTDFVQLGILRFSAMIIAVRLIAALLFWLLLAGLNVFFNSALLMLFYELIQPIETPEKVEAVTPVIN